MSAPAKPDLSGVRRAHERDGCAIVRQVIDDELLEEARAHVAWLQHRHPDTRPELLGTSLVADDPFWVRLVADERLLDVAELFVGPNIALFASHYICKPPFNGQPVLWHQDAAYWPLDPMEVVSLWLAIDDATTENGCMRVIPGSHHMPVAALRSRRDVENVLSSESNIAIDESTAVDVVLQAGDVEVHHPNLFHSSGANRSPRRRCGLTIRYIPTSTRITIEDFPSAFLLRGDAVPGVNHYRARPRFDPERQMPFRGCGE